MDAQKRSDGSSAGYMLDAATCAAILRRTDAAVLERLQQAVVGEVWISAVTLSELMYGAEVSHRTAQERAALEVFLRHVAVLDYPMGAAEEYGRLRMILELCEVEVGTHALLAAAHARSLGMTLVSAKARQLRQAQGMVVESWTHE